MPAFAALVGLRADDCLASFHLKRLLKGGEGRGSSWSKSGEPARWRGGRLFDVTLVREGHRVPLDGAASTVRRGPRRASPIPPIRTRTPDACGARFCTLQVPWCTC